MAPAKKTFVISRPAVAGDAASRIAEIHLAAMDSNPLLHAQFPTSSSLAALQTFLESHTAIQLLVAASGTGGGGVLVAQDPQQHDQGWPPMVVGFAKWDSPSSSSHHREDVVKLETGDLQQQVEGCRREFLDGYAALAEEAKKRVFGDEGCYHLSFVCIDPVYQGQGAGKQLTQAVLNMAAADGLPVYLESTEVAVPMYERLGFKAVGSFEMKIPRRGGGRDSRPKEEEEEEEAEIYREVCMVWRSD
ncbi:hypothetical protein B0H63DRAFT_207635 [Podospora didyma]|uniref:N-acetyltransferase domain-containing protein n=1 Tax=Podospora didyma TaxID=330526 RepID=A0AAE0NH96_9PEZI|nr:hypothetical protein B0H63DRAFT_207635 [Podospora didyma]